MPRIWPRSIGRAAFVAVGAGAIAFSVLVAHIGLGAIAQAMRALGWGGFGLIVALHLGVIGLAGCAWWNLGRGLRVGRLRCFVWGRLIRDSAGEALPFSQVGGFVMGARAAALCGVSGTFAAASTVVDLTVELAGRVPYMVLGLAMLVWLAPVQWLVVPALLGTLLLAAAAVAFFTVTAHGAGAIDAAIEKLGARLAPQWAAARGGTATALQATIRAIHADRGAMGAGVLLHFAGWLLSGIEVALPLWLMGVHLSFPMGIREGIVIDCAVSAIRSATFVAPNVIGLQEGAYVLLCGLFGIDPQVALALSLLRRGRDLAIAIPSLLAWQLREGQLAWRGAGRDPLAPAIPAPVIPAPVIPAPAETFRPE
ncbi:lysylphosphatidylglycerol synthase domain-containing protein [Limobrevibacterium gyesilva]|uniref:Lysylphosphatidylglycerol synthase domain-containing protein n=1 Tax=Limobrevibacterium gyesilva TaxID=2991712 RepID=A0AA42CHE2_9PROT|nr:lysylphosphatidylglycerol synthase domain-containing protein [Limobrevibacterium gyesilva]MCW3477166.1 lysylphosphatidylglycerol synthase domain-containing protein [Limobrevibacterium gyesilva]